MVTISEVGELALLRRLEAFLAPPGGGLLVGPGDDAAVWQPPARRAVVVTTDSLAEGAHFAPGLDAAGAADLGWKLLAVSLSDLAAMGADTGPAFVSLALPGGCPVAWVEALYRGLGECAEATGACVAGGNITSADSIVLTSTCLGSVDPRRVLRRPGAMPGWELAVTGTVGGAAAMRECGGDAAEPAWRATARPQPRLAAGRLLLESGIGVAMDVSDGIYLDSQRMLAVAGAPGLRLDADALPLAAGIRQRWPGAWPALAGGGEDYELLFAGPPEVVRGAIDRLADLPLPATVVGRFDDGPGLWLTAAGADLPLPASGHEHFAP